MPDRSCIADWPVRRFRPWARKPSELLRYDEEKRVFVPDDGAEALSFVGLGDVEGTHYSGAPSAWCLDPPLFTNVLGVFQDHLVLRQPVTPDRIADMSYLGGDYADFFSHPNVVAGQAAMSECSKKYGCANGKSRRMHARESPDGCAFCADNGRGHKIILCRYRINQLRELTEQRKRRNDELVREMEQGNVALGEMARSLADSRELLDRLVKGAETEEQMRRFFQEQTS